MDDLELFEEDFLDPTGPHSNEEIDFESSSDDGSTPHYQVMKPSELAGLLKSRAEGSTEVFTIIDVRDDDCLGGTIPGSINHPAFVFEAEIDKMVERYRRTPKLIFHCRHSQIRGPQCATLFSERLHELYPEDIHVTKVYLLENGFEGWICRYGASNELLVQDFHASVWKGELEGLSPLKRMLYTHFDPKDEEFSVANMKR